MDERHVDRADSGRSDYHTARPIGLPVALTFGLIAAAIAMLVRLSLGGRFDWLAVIVTVAILVAAFQLATDQRVVRLVLRSGFANVLESIVLLSYSTRIPAGGKALERIIALEERILGQTDPQVARLLIRSAKFARRRGDHERARAYLKRLLGQHDQTDAEDERTADVLVELGSIAIEEGDQLSARAYLQRALAVHKRNAGMEDPTIAGLHEELNPLIWDNYKVARQCFYLGQVLADRSRRSPAKDTAKGRAVVSFLADFGMSQQRLLGSEDPQSYVERVTDVHERDGGVDSRAMGLILAHLGALLRREGDTEGARYNLSRALSMEEQALSQDHPALANLLIELAMVVWEQGDLASARSYLERAVAIHVQALGQDHPAVSTLELLLESLTREIDRSVR